MSFIKNYMKNIFTSFLVMLILHDTHAQSKRGDAVIRKLDQVNAATLVSNDTIKLKEYLADDFLLNSSNNKISFSAERILSSLRTGQMRYLRFDVVTDTVYYINNLTAISMGTETTVYGNDGPLKGVAQKRRYTNIWTAEKNVWKLKARHSSSICE